LWLVTDPSLLEFQQPGVSTLHADIYISTRHKIVGEIAPPYAGSIVYDEPAERPKIILAG